MIIHNNLHQQKLFLHLCSPQEQCNRFYSEVFPCDLITMQEISGIRRPLFIKIFYYKIYWTYQSYYPKQIFMEMISFNSLLSSLR